MQIEHTARFTNALARLGVSDGEKILLAVSGGPDSVAMLLLAHHLMPDRIVAATVDHQLRPAAAAEAEFVAVLCAERAVPHHTLQPDQPITGNIQSAARSVRYALLEQAADHAGCRAIATAHHGDDQLETLLMRLSRGSGVDGMSGIRARNGRIIRPMIEFSKSELEEICKSACVEAVRDPSNDDIEFDRAAIRQWLASAPHPFDVTSANRTASALHDASTAISWMADHLSESRISKIHDEIQCDVSGLPHELRRRLALLALALLDPDLYPRGDALERLISGLTNGRTLTIGNILCRGGNPWRFTPAPPRRGV